MSQLESNISPPEGNVLSEPQIDLTAEIKHQGLGIHDKEIWTESEINFSSIIFLQAFNEQKNKPKTKTTTI